MKLNWLFGALAWLAATSVMAQDLDLMDKNPKSTGQAANTNTIPKSAGPLSKDIHLDPPGAASVKQDSLNVRSLPEFSGDILGHIHKGQIVKVFEQITLAKPKNNEPANWSRIALPSDAAVWVFADYVNTNAMTISRTRVNLRGGPGDNFTIVSRLEKGEPVKEVRRSKDWIQIEPPANASGFVATEYLTMEPTPAVVETPPPATTPPAAVAVTTPPPTPEPVTPPAAVTPEVAKPAADTNTTAAATPVATTPEPANTVATPPPTNAVAEATNATPAAITTPIVAPEPVVTAPPPTPVTTPTNAPPAAVPEPAPTPAPVAATDATVETKPRTISREGFIHKAINIQAPADFELRDVNSGDIIEYVQPAPKDKDFKKYVGQRVLISGSEWVDRRWPKRPILKVETVDVVH